MLTVYLVCLTFGGILVLVSVFGGDAEIDASDDLDGLADDSSPSSAHSVFQYLSFRGLVFFLAFFGLTGSLLTILGTPAWIVLVAALPMGIFAGGAIQAAIGYLQRTESGQALELKQLEGSRARVLIGCTPDRRGKIVIDTQERTMQLLAVVAEEATCRAFSPGDSVIVVRFRDGVAYISEEDIVM